MTQGGGTSAASLFINSSGVSTRCVAPSGEGLFIRYANRPSSLLRQQVHGDAGQWLVELLAEAGGLTEYARRDRIFVLRSGGTDDVTRIRVRYGDLSRGRGRALDFQLQPGDVLVVE